MNALNDFWRSWNESSFTGVRREVLTYPEMTLDRLLGLRLMLREPVEPFSSGMSGQERQRSRLLANCLRCNVGVNVDLKIYLLFTFFNSTLFLCQSKNSFTSPINFIFDFAKRMC